MPDFFPEGDSPAPTDSARRSMSKVVSLLPAALVAFAASPEPEPEPEAFNAVIVSGAGTGGANGTHAFIGLENGKPFYDKGGPEASQIYWDGAVWVLIDNNTAEIYYISGSDVDFPWEAEWTVATGDLPVPTFTPTNV
jgi:hypothetical protein